MRRSRYSRPEVKMVVAQGEGRVIGWEIGRFVKAGEPCCRDPLSCRRCFGPPEPRWRLWRR